MFRKLAALAGAGALLLSVAGPAFAGFPYYHPKPSGGIDIDNHAFVLTKVSTTADSGDNEIGGKIVKNGTIVTGAAGALAAVSNDVNSSVLGCKRCTGSVDIDNHAFVSTKVYTKADSGDNEIGGKIVKGGLISTGAAGATSIVDQFVNYTQVGI